MELSILFEDDHFIAVNKPAGLLVHKTRLANEANAVFALQLVRDQIGQKVYPLHRLDRPSSGVLLFAKSSEAASILQPKFTSQEIKKYYLAVVRGYMPEAHGIMDRPLSKDLRLKLQNAQTEYWRLAQIEIPLASSDRHPTSRYSLIKVYPHTGRMHQIRRHCAQLRHYIIGDSTHGDNKQNKFFKNNFHLNQLLLHAWQLHFQQPYTGEPIRITAPLPPYFTYILKEFGWEKHLPSIVDGPGDTF